MDVFDYFRLALNALLARKTRSALTIVGIIIGASIILAVESSSAGMSSGISSQVAKIGANVLTIRAGGAMFSSGSTSTYKLSSQDVSPLEAISHVEKVVPYYSDPVTVTLGGESLSGTLIGIDPSALSHIYSGLSLAEGNFPAVSDYTSAVIGDSIAHPTSSTVQLGLNQAVQMKISGVTSTNLAFLVKGILSPYGQALFNNIDQDVFISLQAAQLYFKSSYYSGIYIIVDSADNIGTVQAAIKARYGSDVSVMSSGSIASSISSITGSLSIYEEGIAAVSLFVAAIMTANTMFVTVMERTKEIGVLKAIGFRSKEVLTMFLAECVVTGLVGGVGGTMLGYGLAFVIGGGNAFGPPGGASSGGSTPVFTTWWILFTLFFPIVISMGAGLYPAWRASRMNPIAALKYE